jgi:hypothetical protein
LKSFSASACRLSEVKVVRGANRGSYENSKHHYGVKGKSTKFFGPFFHLSSITGIQDKI